ncbi:MAG: tetratricopeptide repeat protein [Deltaproteobacteria bacterium]|nr:tetratricopeptide repeat protein [Deltaproteobacteria bacterium]
MTPPSYTLRFSSDPALQTLYGDLIVAGESNASLDQGFTSIDYTRVQAGSLRGGTDNNLDSAELFSPVLSSSTLASAYRRFAGEALPWTPSQNATTLTALRRFDQEVASWRVANRLPTGVNRALAEHLFQWITDAQGLNLQVQTNPPERNFDETLANSGGDCTEFTKVLLALMQRAGFTVYPVWVGVDSHGDSVQHIATGLSLGGSTYLLDPVYGAFDAQHRSTIRLSLREFLAWHWNNRALDQQATSVATAEQYYGRALQIDPANPHILVNRGIFLRDQRQNTAGARVDFEAALRVDARFSEAQYELGNIEYDAGRYSEAADRFRLAVTLRGTDSRYRRNLVLSLVQAGNRTEALRQYEALVRVDSQAPGLVRLARLVGGSPPLASSR